MFSLIADSKTGENENFTFKNKKLFFLFKEPLKIDLKNDIYQQIKNN